ncbi:MAG TPA: hypothetical protein VEO74_10200, partial [Thermoanaerobaculia bacterium]|nr:hypothetical protein [Thermoanaerobaculia bacterium]
MIRRLAALFLLLSTAVAADVPVSTAPLAAAPGFRSQPQIASDGANFLVVWVDSRAQIGYPSVWATLVGPDGRVVGPPAGSRVSPQGSRSPAV